MPPETIAELDAANARPGVVFRPRSREELARFFERLEQVPPGIQSVAKWRAARALLSLFSGYPDVSARPA